MMDILTAYGHLDTMQKVCIAEGTEVTLDEWIAEHDVEKQKRYYSWVRQQYLDTVLPWAEYPPAWH